MANPPEPTVPIRVEISGTSDCPGADSFFEQLKQRTTHARHTRDGELGWSASIFVKSIGTRRHARLKLMASEGEWIERELVAPDCSAALEALTVVLAVLVDTAVEQAPPEEEPIRSKAPRGNTKPLALPRVATGVYIPWIDDPDFFEKRGVSLSVVRFVPRITGGAELDTQLANGLGFGFGAGFEIERWSASSLRPSFGLTLVWATADLASDNARGDVYRWSLRAHLCPFDLLQSRAVALRPCGKIDTGYVYFNVAYVDDLDGSFFGTTAGRLGFVRSGAYLRFVIVPAGGAQLRLDGGLDLLAWRREIRANNPARLRLYDPPAFGGSMAISVAVEY